MHALDETPEFSAVVREWGIKLAGCVRDSESNTSGACAHGFVGGLDSMFPPCLAIVHARLHGRRSIEDNHRLPRLARKPFHLGPRDRHRNEESSCYRKENREIAAQLFEQRVLDLMFEDSFPQLRGGDDDLSAAMLQEVECDDSGGCHRGQQSALKTCQREKSHRVLRTERFYVFFDKLPLLKRNGVLVERIFLRGCEIRFHVAVIQARSLALAGFFDGLGPRSAGWSNG